MPSEGVRYVRVVQAYVGSGRGQLSLAPGDVIALMSGPSETDQAPISGATRRYYYGRNVVSRRQGFFPRCHVQPVTDGVLTPGASSAAPSSTPSCSQLLSTAEAAASSLVGALSLEPDLDASAATTSASAVSEGSGRVGRDRSFSTGCGLRQPSSSSSSSLGSVSGGDPSGLARFRGSTAAGGCGRALPVCNDEWREIINDSGYGGSPVRVARPIYTHLLQGVFFVTPILCTHCGDYIWGSGPIGQQCTECGNCFHNSCAKCSPLHACQRGNPDSTLPVTYPSPLPVSTWSPANVLEWMASVNLISPVDIFRAKNISGKELLDLDAEKLTALGISDTYVQNSLLLAIQRLRADEGGAAGPIWPATGGVGGGHSASDHQLRAASFCTLVTCTVCDCLLLGSDHQGLACIECGLIVHRQCASQPAALPCCGRQASNDHTSSTTTTRPAFSRDLTQLFQPSCEPAPQLLIRCLHQLEQRCLRQLQQAAVSDSAVSSAFSCFQLYDHSVDWQQLEPLWRALERDVDNFDPESYETSQVACLVKKFLAHLPNPVIPVQHYDHLIQLTEKYMNDGTGCESDVDAFISQLPVHHLSVLQTLAGHVIRLCQLEHSRVASVGYRQPPAQLLRAFSYLLVRPPFEQITLWPERTSLHARALELLLMHHEWNGEQFPQCDPPPALPPRPSTRQQQQQVPQAVTTAMGSARTAICPSLQRAEWYWGSISREEVAEKMSGQPDGAFLVRDSHTTDSEYTLTLRKGGNNRLIRIYCRGGRYGFSEPCQFASVAALVQHYRHVSLRDYNAQLDVRLELPLVDARQYGERQTSELMSELSQVHDLTVRKSDELDSVEQHRTVVAERLANQRRARESFHELLDMLREQQQLQRNTSCRVQQQQRERDLLAENWQLLEQRVVQVQRGLQLVDDDLRRQSSYCLTAEHELEALRSEQSALLLQLRELQRELLRRGVCRQQVEELMAGAEHDQVERQRSSAGDIKTVLAEEATSTDVDTVDLRHQRQQTPPPSPSQHPQQPPSLPPPDSDMEQQQHLWLLEDCDRSRAVQLLANRPDGTFLVRRRANGQLALSVVALSQVRHCCIEQSASDGRLGFSAAHAVFANVADLVQHYSLHELSEHNHLLPVRLVYPVLANHEQRKTATSILPE